MNCHKVIFKNSYAINKSTHAEEPVRENNRVWIEPGIQTPFEKKIHHKSVENTKVTVYYKKLILLN